MLILASRLEWSRASDAQLGEALRDWMLAEWRLLSGSNVFDGRPDPVAFLDDEFAALDFARDLLPDAIIAAHPAGTLKRIACCTVEWPDGRLPDTGTHALTAPRAILAASLRARDLAADRCVSVGRIRAAVANGSGAVACLDADVAALAAAFDLRPGFDVANGRVRA